MKKITVFAGASHAEEAVDALRRLGIVHVRLRAGIVGEAADVEQRLDRVAAALKKLPVAVADTAVDKRPGSQIVSEILTVSEERDRLASRLDELDKGVEWYDTWHAPSLNKLTELRDAGVTIRLFTANKKQWEKVAGTPGLIPVGQTENVWLIAQIAQAGADAPNLPEERLPTVEKEKIVELREEMARQVASLADRLSALAGSREELEAHRLDLESRLAFEKVKESLIDQKGIRHLEGYAPVDTLDKIRRAAEKNGWAYVFEEPGDDDPVPTLIRNPKWIQIINPVLDFLGTIPGYKELDVSLPFLLFFALFVAMLVGDAGYGLVYLLLTAVGHVVLKKKMPAQPFILMYVLSLCTIAWGVASGNYFGSETIANLPIVEKLTVPAMAAFKTTTGGFNDNEGFLIGLCFKIGVVHLTLAHVLAGLKKSDSLRCLAEIGWIGVLWGLYFVTGMLVLNHAFPPFAGVLIAAGALLALVFTNWQKHVLKGIADTIIELPLGLIGAFSDIVSYLRLFAVGYASLVLANTFNGMAAGAEVKGGVMAVAAALILFAGHSLNMVLAGMGVVVHGIRLQMLEFSGHVGNEWTGTEYQPFASPDNGEAGN
ncbi:MAG: hypothetical protein RRC34_03805 [Lentisphaeria bacterium]|nr:hypothetical protein [Lentisphaeria bacterium]